MPTDPSEITRLLRRWSHGERAALDRAVPLLYGELRGLAHQRRTRHPGEPSLNTTGLVHEAYLRLAAGPGADLRDRQHFLAVAARVMRNVLVDHARAQHAAKRGGGATVLEFDEEAWISTVDLTRVTELDDALRKLEAVDERQGRIVEQHYFGGLAIDEIASVLELSTRTVKRELRSARAWLASELSP
jgi:RNA polymerase sigma factor (TIGR02999 family)